MVLAALFALSSAFASPPQFVSSGSAECYTLTERGFPRMVGPKSHCKKRLLLDERIVSEWEFSTDAFGRRVVPGGTPPGARSFVAFLGCSFTFGEGVTDEQSLPAQFARMLKPGEMAVYNYGEAGYGPNNVLESLQTRALNAEIPQKSGVFVYNWIADHLPRAIGTLSHDWVDLYPDYRIDADGRPVFDGSHRSAHPFRFAFYEVLRKLRIAKLLGIDFPRYTSSHIQLAVALLRESARLTAERFPGSKFYVVLWPKGLFSNDLLGPMVREVFQQAFATGPVRLLDYTDVPVNLEHDRLPDGHPSAEMYTWMARRIAHDLSLHPQPQ